MSIPAESTELIVFILRFALVALAAWQVGAAVTRVHLPRITGYLLTGLVAGPLVLGLLHEEEVASLRFIDEAALAFIAFAAGAELYLPELRGRLRTIGLVTAGRALAVSVVVTVTLLLLADTIPFARDLDGTGQLSVALLGGVIMVAISPSAAIAIVNEVRARGPFTQVALGTTVVTDIVVITLFAIAVSISVALFAGSTVDPGFVVLLLAELALALGAGLAAAWLLSLLLRSPLSANVKAALILLVGYAVFVGAERLAHWSHDALGSEFHVEPLLVALVASFALNNYSRNRREWIQLIHDYGAPVYVAFFTLTGAALELDILLRIWPIALALFGARLIAVMVGSFAAGIVAGESMQHNRLRWMALITQAGVAIGLAKEVAVTFPQLGNAFATMIISVVVINEIVGPVLFRGALARVGETHLPVPHTFDGVRDALIFGLEGQSLALARQLSAHGWQARVVSRKANHVAGVDDTDVTIEPVEEFSPEALEAVGARGAEAYVLLLSDEENHALAELINERFGAETLVVRLNERANFERFHSLGALVVDPATAMVGLLDHLVRSPVAASLVLGMEPGQDIVDLVLREPRLSGRAIRDLSLPLDTLIVSVHRNGHMISTHGFTRLQLGDRVTVLGSEESLEEVALKFGN